MFWDLLFHFDYVVRASYFFEITSDEKGRRFCLGATNTEHPIPTLICNLRGGLPSAIRCNFGILALQHFALRKFVARRENERYQL